MKGWKLTSTKLDAGLYNLKCGPYDIQAKKMGAFQESWILSGVMLDRNRAGAFESLGETKEFWAAWIRSLGEEESVAALNSGFDVSRHFRIQKEVLYGFYPHLEAQEDCAPNDCWRDRAGRTQRQNMPLTYDKVLVARKKAPRVRLVKCVSSPRVRLV